MTDIIFFGICISLIGVILILPLILVLAWLREDKRLEDAWDAWDIAAAAKHDAENESAKIATVA